MADPNTIRILSLDGGGVRGYLSLKFLQNFISRWGVNGNDLWKHFDVIAGTSIGGIQALGYAYGKSPDELEPFFLDKAKKIFTIRTPFDVGSCNTTSESNRPNTAQKILFIIENTPFYEPTCPLPGGDSNYGSNVLHETLVEEFGTDTLANLKTKVVIPSYQDDTDTYVYFSNYQNSMLLGQDETIVNVARATSAAPEYLPSYSFGSPTVHRYIDGGLYQNNPAEVALNVGKSLKPLANRYCVLSIGTGIGDMGFDSVALKRMLKEGNVKSTDSAISKLFALFDIASTGGQESVDFNLRLASSNTLDQLYYYRFQPKLDENLDTELDNSDASFLTYMANLADTKFNEDLINIDNFIGHLSA